MDLHPVKVVIDAIDNPAAIRFQGFFENHAPLEQLQGRPSWFRRRPRPDSPCGGGKGCLVLDEGNDQGLLNMEGSADSYSHFGDRADR